MAELSEIKIDGVTYDIMDALARATLNNIEKNYELIDTITVEEVGLRLITIMQEPDGTVYNFNKLYLNIIVPKANASGVFYIAINGKTFVPMMGSITSSFDGGTIGQMKVSLENGFLDGYGVGANNQTTSSNLVRYVTPYLIPGWAKNIAKVDIRSTVDIPVGTIIEIYGVRA